MKRCGFDISSVYYTCVVTCSTHNNCEIYCSHMLCSTCRIYIHNNTVHMWYTCVHDIHYELHVMYAYMYNFMKRGEKIILYKLPHLSYFIFLIHDPMTPPVLLLISTTRDRSFNLMPDQVLNCQVVLPHMLFLSRSEQPILYPSMPLISGD